MKKQLALPLHKAPGERWYSLRDRVRAALAGFELRQHAREQKRLRARRRWDRP